MSRASLVRCSCPWRVKPIFPMTHRPCLTSSWVTSTAVSGNQRPTGCGPGPAKRSPRIARGRPPAMSIALRQSQMDIFDFILISRDRFYGGMGVWRYLPCGTPRQRSPLFPRKQRSPGSARSRPGREAAQRTLDGEDRSGIIQGEGKGETTCRQNQSLGRFSIHPPSGPSLGAVPSLPAGINRDDSDPAWGRIAVCNNRRAVAKRPVLDHHRNGCPGSWQRSGHRHRLRAASDALISDSCPVEQDPRRCVNRSKEKP